MMYAFKFKNLCFNLFLSTSYKYIFVIKAFFEWMSIDGMNRLRVKDARSYTLASSMKTTISLMCGKVIIILYYII